MGVQGKKRQSFSLLMATFIGTMDSNALVPIIALYALFLDPNISGLYVGLIVAMYSIVHIPSNIVFGRLMDKIGRRNPLVLGLSWDAFSVFLYSVVGSPIQLLLVRCMHGIGGGFVGPSSMSIAASMASEGRKGRMMALYGISLAFSVIVGFMLSGILVDRFSYDVLFYVLALSLVVGVAFAASIQEPHVFGRARTTLLEDFRKFLEILRRKLARSSYTAIFSLYFAMGSFTLLVPLYMESFGLKEINVAMAFTVFAVLSLIVHYPSGMLSDKLGPKVPAIAGLLTISLSLTLLPFMETFSTMIPVMALFGVGHGLVFPSSSTMIVRSSSEDEMGLSTGVFYALLVAGVAIGAPIAGFLADIFFIEMALWATAVATTVGGMIVLAMLRRA